MGGGTISDDARERRDAGLPQQRGELEAAPSAAWLARARAGDPDAFGELVRHYETDVARLCRRILGPCEEARDAAQEAFARAHAALAGYDPERPFRPWLLAIASHRAIDALRRRRRETRLFDGLALEAESLADAGPSPLQHGLSAERRGALLGAIDALPDPYRAALVLRYYADLELAAIAETLGVSSNQVATLLFRGRRRLRDALGGEAS
jgi:RNA polymerase sigma-70 factor (ECF subfamily)